MKIWITEIGEPLLLEREARKLRYGQMAPLWAQAGVDVTWWASTFSHAPRTHIVKGDQETRVDGVRLKLLHGPGYQKSVSLARVRHQRHFARRFREQAARESTPDLILSPIPTLEVTEAAIAYGKAHGVPVILDIRDEWPEEFARLAPPPFRGLARLALFPWYQALRTAAREATGIVGITERLRDYGLRFAGREAGPRDGVFSFGYDGGTLSESARSEALRRWRERGLKEGLFTLCFFGTIGRFFEFDGLIEAVRALPDVQLVLCGDGSALPALKEKIADCPRILTPGWVGADAIRTLMEVSSVGVAPYCAGTAMSLSNKPVEYLSGGLAIVATPVGELNRLLESHGCGLTVESQDWRSAIEKLRNDAELLETSRRNARALFEARFEISRVSENMLGHLRSVAKSALQPSGSLVPQAT